MQKQPSIALTLADFQNLVIDKTKLRQLKGGDGDTDQDNIITEEEIII